MTRSRRPPSSTHIERLAVVEERLDGLAGDVSDINGKLDRLLDLAQDRAVAIGDVQSSVSSLQRSVGSLRDDTKIIRDGMGFARILRRILFWGAPLVAFAFWAVERSDILMKLFRKP